MLFELPPAAQALQSVARRLADTAIAPRAAEVDRAEAYPWDNVAALREAGLLGYTIPREYGGAGGSFLDAVVIIEEMARVCGVTGRIAVETNMGAISRGDAVRHARRRSGSPRGWCWRATSRRSASPSPRPAPPPPT